MCIYVCACVSVLESAARLVVKSEYVNLSIMKPHNHVEEAEVEVGGKTGTGIGQGSAGQGVGLGQTFTKRCQLCFLSVFGPYSKRKKTKKDKRAKQQTVEAKATKEKTKEKSTKTRRLYGN